MHCHVSWVVGRVSASDVVEPRRRDVQRQLERDDEPSIPPRCAAVAVPPWTSRTRRVIARPSPVPSWLSACAVRARDGTGRNRLGTRLSGDSRAVIANLDDGARRARRRSRRSPAEMSTRRAVGGVAHRVADHVLDRAAHHVAARPRTRQLRGADRPARRSAGPAPRSRRPSRLRPRHGRRSNTVRRSRSTPLSTRAIVSSWPIKRVQALGFELDAIEMLRRRRARCGGAPAQAPRSAAPAAIAARATRPTSSCRCAVTRCSIRPPCD